MPASPPATTITLHYDPMIAKLIVLGEDRRRRHRHAWQWALRHYVVLGEVTTNIPFLRAVLAHPTFAAGEQTTAFVEEEFAAWQPPAGPPPDAALIAAALGELLAPASLAAQGAALPRRRSLHSLAAAHRLSHWKRRQAVTRELHYQQGGDSAAVTVTPQEEGWLVVIGDRRYAVQAQATERGRFAVEIDGKRVLAHVARQGSRVQVHLDGRVWDLERTTGAASPRRRSSRLHRAADGGHAGPRARRAGEAG